MQSQLVFVRLLVIHSISCLVTFTLAPNSSAVLSDRQKYLKTGRSSKFMKTLLDIVGVGGIKEADVRVNSLRIENLFAPRQQVVTTLKTYFTSQLKGGALGFLGSLEALGNPKHLLMGYASAVSDIFIEPAASAVSSPKDGCNLIKVFHFFQEQLISFILKGIHDFFIQILKHWPVGSIRKVLSQQSFKGDRRVVGYKFYLWNLRTVFDLGHFNWDRDERLG